jgi:perosamine synthetase
MDRIIELARRFRLIIVEDATESLGATYRGRNVGALGDIACLSFNGNKLITTGGGGMVVTADETLAKRCRYLSTQAKDDPVEYVHGAVGYNYRLTNISAALGCAQLERIDDHIAVKRRISERYRQGIKSTPGLSFPEVAPWAGSVCWLSTVLVDRHTYGLDSRELMDHLARKGIGSRPLWQPLHLSPAHRAGVEVGAVFPVAERLAADALSLPSSVGLREEEQARVIEVLREARSGGDSRMDSAVE